MVAVLVLAVILTVVVESPPLCLAVVLDGCSNAVVVDRVALRSLTDLAPCREQGTQAYHAAPAKAPRALVVFLLTLSCVQTPVVCQAVVVEPSP